MTLIYKSGLIHITFSKLLCSTCRVHVPLSEIINFKEQLINSIQISMEVNCVSITCNEWKKSLVLITT